jgi:hypothetical protein
MIAPRQLTLAPSRPAWSGVIVEPYAGSAAVSMQALGLAPACKYQGGKRGYAVDILRHLGVDRPPSALHLADVGGWYYVWAAVERGGWAPILQALDALDVGDTDATIRPAYQARRRAFPRNMTVDFDAPDMAERAALWLWCLFRSFGGGGPWRGYGPVRSRNGGINCAPDRPARDVRAIAAAWPDVRVYAYPSAAAVPALAGAVVYFDPPYPATAGYSDSAGAPTDEQICAQVHAHHSAAAIGVSLHRPIDGLPLRSVELTKRGRVRSSSAQQRELLYVSR